MKRYSSIDGLRGLVVLLMIMHHSLDAWVRDPERHGFLWRALRHLGGLPAPGFMLLAGLSAALVAAKERSRGATARQRAWTGVRRGLYVLGIAFAFRVAMFLVDGNHWDEWAIIFRVDILNCMGVSLAIAGAACAFAPSRRWSIGVALALMAISFLPSPFLYGRTIEFPSIFLGNYVAGRGPLVLFPLFPWLGFTAAGFATGEYLAQALARGSGAPNAILAAATWPLLAIGLFTFSAGLWIGLIPVDLYPPHDYWNASPIFMSMRVAIQLALLGAFAWYWRDDARGLRSDFLQLLGRHSLFVYLLHLEFIYGRVATPLQRQLPIAQALLGAAAIAIAFTAGARAIEWRSSRRTVSRTAPVALPEASAGG